MTRQKDFVFGQFPSLHPAQLYFLASTLEQVAGLPPSEAEAHLASIPISEIAKSYGLGAEQLENFTHFALTQTLADVIPLTNKQKRV